MAVPAQPAAEALAMFQRGMEALQRHAYPDAATAFQAVIMGFPAERALLDRARVYLELCQRESGRRPPPPKTIEERLTAATAALNNDDDQAAEELARSVLGDDPKHDLAIYLLAAVMARRGAIADALEFLGKAIALSPEASAQARSDDDFLPLHDEDAFWTLTEPPIASTGPRRRRTRGDQR
jgi:tetratricopeptide (TPR) repeat protein